MSQSSAIEWTGATWNPVTGCSKVSPGCAHCYAERFAERWRGILGHPYEQGFDLRLWPERLELPLQWRRPRLVFVNSMSDLFHQDIPDAFVHQVLAVIEQATRHTFQVLTKRPERMRQLISDFYRARELDRPPGDRPTAPLLNLWLGVSIENRRFVHRATILRHTPAAVRFISAEPLLGPLIKPQHGWDDDHPGPGLSLNRIDWLIVGGESGPRHRPIRPQWVRDLRDATRPRTDDDLTQLPGRHCAFFFKQWGGRTPKAGGRLLDGRTWAELPTVRQQPVDDTKPGR